MDCLSHILILGIFISPILNWATTEGSTEQCGEYIDDHYYHCPTIIPRSEWGAREAKESTQFKPWNLKYVVVHHSATPECSDKSSCISRVQNIQNYHMDGRNYSDIAYNYLISGEGLIFVGRGNKVQGAHAKYYNNVSMGICLIGDFTTKAPSIKALTSLKKMLFCLLGKFDMNFELKGHRELSQTKCPGDALYEAIKHCPFYEGSSKSPSSAATTTAPTTPSSAPTSTPTSTESSSRSSGISVRNFTSRFNLLLSVFLIGNCLTQNVVH